MNKDAIICDIDGTLANIEHRRKYLPDWKKFNESMDEDTPNEWCTFLLDSIFADETTTAKVIYVSGREECYRSITIDQISRWTYCLTEDIILFMRPTKDNRPDIEIKAEIYEREIKDKYDVKFVLDDRKKVVDMWRDLGLVCLQCDIGDF